MLPISVICKFIKYYRICDIIIIIIIIFRSYFYSHSFFSREFFFFPSLSYLFESNLYKSLTFFSRNLGSIVSWSSQYYSHKWKASPHLHLQKVRNVQRQIRQRKPGEKMCTARPTYLAMSVVEVIIANFVFVTFLKYTWYRNLFLSLLLLLVLLSK